MTREEMHAELMKLKLTNKELNLEKSKYERCDPQKIEKL
jgi:hypothetical protein